MGYLPSAKFWFNREYLAQWQVGIYPGWTLESVANPLIARNEYPGIGYQYLHFKVFDEVWAASSNTYSLDHVVEACYNTYSWFGGVYPSAFNVTWTAGIAPGCNALILDAGAPTKYFAVNALQPPYPTWYLPATCSEILA